jgi:hypothetical protein
MRQARQGSDSDETQKALGLLCAELCGGALSSVARKRNVSEPDFLVPVLESDSDSHLSEDEDISARSDSDIDSDTNCTHWNVNTNCWPTVPVVHKFTRDPSGLQQTIKTLPHLAF